MYVTHLTATTVHEWSNTHLPQTPTTSPSTPTTPTAAVSNRSFVVGGIEVANATDGVLHAVVPLLDRHPTQCKHTVQGRVHALLDVVSGERDVGGL